MIEVKPLRKMQYEDIVFFLKKVKKEYKNTREVRCPWLSFTKSHFYGSYGKVLISDVSHQLQKLEDDLLIDVLYYVANGEMHGNSLLKSLLESVDEVSNVVDVGEKQMISVHTTLMRPEATKNKLIKIIYNGQPVTPVFYYVEQPIASYEFILQSGAKVEVKTSSSYNSVAYSWKDTKKKKKYMNSVEIWEKWKNKSELQKILTRYCSETPESLLKRIVPWIDCTVIKSFFYNGAFVPKKEKKYRGLLKIQWDAPEKKVTIDGKLLTSGDIVLQKVPYVEGIYNVIVSADYAGEDVVRAISIREVKKNHKEKIKYKRVFHVPVPVAAKPPVLKIEKEFNAIRYSYCEGGEPVFTIIVRKDKKTDSLWGEVLDERNTEIVLHDRDFSVMDKILAYARTVEDVRNFLFMF